MAVGTDLFAGPILAEWWQTSLCNQFRADDVRFGPEAGIIVTSQ
jgi:hypothetical protein